MEIKSNGSVIATILLSEDLYGRITTLEEDLHLSRFIRTVLSQESLLVRAAELRRGRFRKGYQPSGLALRRINFRLPDVLWASISELSHSTGYSRCYLVAWIIDQYLKEVGANSVVITTPFNKKNILNRDFCMLVLRVLDIQKQVLNREGRWSRGRCDGTIQL